MLALETVIISFLISLSVILIYKRKSGSKPVSSLIKCAFAAFALSLSAVSITNLDNTVLAFEMFDKKIYGIALIISALCSLLIWALFFILNRLNACDEKTEAKNKTANRIKIISFVVFSLGISLMLGELFVDKQWSGVAMEQLLVNMTSPTEGTELSIYLTGFQFVLIAFCLIYIFGVCSFSKFRFKLDKQDKATNRAQDILTSFVLLVFAFSITTMAVIDTNSRFNLSEGVNALFVESDFIEQNYVKPEETTVTFPEKKRNLIYIYLESVENTYLSKDLGGYMNENLMPELTALAKRGTVFSDNSSKFGGPQPVTGTTWSLASMVNQTMGLPLKFTGNTSSYSKENGFLKNAKALGDYLDEEGYEQEIMIGASAVFGGLDNMYVTHGNYTVFDYNYAKKNGYIPENYKVWWGYEDDKLYEFAKKEITRLYNTGKPFNFTMENADTHMPDGYLAPDKPRPYKSPYANAILYSTSQVTKFVEWIEKQPFYENTTVVLIGDHLSMDKNFFKGVDPTYHRSQFNLILNSPVSASSSRYVKRNYSNMDMFPTTLAALGCSIEGNRLGLGTNLFSNEKTLLEKYGTENFSKELTKKSEFYNQLAEN